MKIIDQVLTRYGFNCLTTSTAPFGTGLINNTWLVKNNDQHFILQRINHTVFKKPADISYNIRLIGNYLKKHYPGFLFVLPEKTLQQEDLVFITGEGYFRLFPFVNNSHTIDVVNNPAQAFEAAKQFGRFTRLLSDFPCNDLKITLPDFHNLVLRYRQFEQAISNGNTERIKEATDIIQFLVEHNNIVSISEQITINPAFKKRVTHHDTKISNVLFDEYDKGLCVIDLDTVMPGYFISDVGDMIRTYLSPVSEEEKDFSKVGIREEYFKAIAEGYMNEMADELSEEEKNHFVYAGKFMIYMQALRFLTDHLNNDVYYGARYDGHNHIRAMNQVTLLKRLMEKEKRLTEIFKQL